MIDTDKYEGHTPAPWSVDKETPDVLETDEWIAEMQIYNQATGDEVVLKQCDTQLIADAPLLLAEVKRLREQLAKANKFVHAICQHSDSMLMDYEDYMKGDESSNTVDSDD